MPEILHQTTKQPPGLIRDLDALSNTGNERVKEKQQAAVRDACIKNEICIVL